MEKEDMHLPPRAVPQGQVLLDPSLPAEGCRPGVRLLPWGVSWILVGGGGQEGLSGPGVPYLDSVLPFQNERRFSVFCLGCEVMRAAFERVGAFGAWRYVRGTAVLRAPARPSAPPGPEARAPGVHGSSGQVRG